MTETNYRLSIAEETLCDLIAAHAAAHAGELAHGHGWHLDDLNATKEAARIAGAVKLAAAAFVETLRAPDARVYRPDELEVVARGIAVGVLQEMGFEPKRADVVH